MARLELTTKRYPAALVLAVAFPFIALVGVADWATGPVAMSLLYYVPIVGAAWLAGVWPGVLSALGAGASLTLVALIQAVHPMPVVYWNSLTRVVTFVALAFAVGLLRRDRDALDALNRRLNAALENEAGLARTDALTGIANGRAFRETLARELARSQRVGGAIAVGYVDLDNFKGVNDRFGHDRGDSVLRSVATVLTESIRAIDLAARLGGDEFVIAIVDPGERTCETIGSRIIERMRVVADEYPDIGFGATIGFASFQEAPADAETILKRADDVMYEAKMHGKGRFAILRC